MTTAASDVKEVITKSEIMARVCMGTAHECFQHSEEGWFDITLMRKWARQNCKIEYVEVAQIIDHILASRVLDMARVDELSAAEWQSDPALVVLYENAETNDIEHLMVDGHHRAVRAHREGLKLLPVYMVPESMIFRPPPNFLKGLDWGDEDLVDGKIVKRG